MANGRRVRRDPAILSEAPLAINRLILLHLSESLVDPANHQRLNNPDYKSSSSPSDQKLAAPSSQPSELEGVPKPPTTSRRKFSMQALNNEEYEPVRVPRPEGVSEWGGGVGGEEAPVKGKRREDRWV